MPLAAHPRPRQTRLVAAGAVVAGLLASAGVVWQASDSAFSATTANPTNSWSTGTVSLDDDDTNTAMFNASNLGPGATGTRCIAVTSSGSLPSAVKLYGTNAMTTNALSSSLNLAIVQGTGGGFGTCTGFTPLGTDSSVYSGTLAGFASGATTYATGLGTWTPTGAGTETRVFRFTWTLDPAAPNSVQAGAAGIGFTWEAQNT